MSSRTSSGRKQVKLRKGGKQKEESKLLCSAKLSNGEPCPKTVERGKTLCRWHDPEDETWREVYARLKWSTTSEERTDIVLGLIEDHPERVLELPERDGQKADLYDIDLSQETLDKKIALLKADAPWWSSFLKSPDFSSANLQGARLLDVNLQGACLSYANLQGAELVNVNLQNVDLKWAVLQGAHLLDSKLQHANLYKAELQGAHLGGTNLQDAEIRNANLQGTQLVDCSLQGAKLLETDLQGASLRGANLQGAYLWRANLQSANLYKAELQGAYLRDANLQGALLLDTNLQASDLRGAKLQDVDLSDVSNMSNVYISGAWLDRTRIEREKLGNAIGEELKHDYAEARRGYLMLKKNFDDLGDYDSASWAYRKERKMEKLEARAMGRASLKKRKWRDATSGYFKFFSDTIVEWLCDYGESAWRVIGWMAVLLFVVGPFTFSTLGGIVWGEDLANDYYVLSSTWDRFWFSYRLYLLYTLDTFTTANFSGLQPINDAVKLASGFFAIAGIVLAGLLGFVAGNRIRRS